MLATGVRNPLLDQSTTYRVISRLFLSNHPRQIVKGSRSTEPCVSMISVLMGVGIARLTALWKFKSPLLIHFCSCSSKSHFAFWT